MIEIRHLRAFEAVAEELHFQRAARSLGVSQPTLSLQIKDLEELIGVTLFDRDRRSVAVSEAGRLFEVRVRTILEQLDLAAREMRAFSESATQTLRVAYLDYLNLESVTAAIVSFQAANPSFKIERVDMATHEIEDALKENRIDLGFGPANVTHPALITRMVAKGAWSIVMPKDHPYADHESVPVSTLAGEPLVFFDREMNPVLHDRVLSMFEERGVAPRIVLETRQIATALRMVADGSALYLVASYIVSDMPDSLVMRPLAETRAQIAAAAIWHESNQPEILKAFLKRIPRA